MHTTGSIDTVGTLYGPDGSRLLEDDNSGDGTISGLPRVSSPGLHLVEVRGQTRRYGGCLQLVTNFVTGEEVTTPTRPGTGSDLQTRVDELEAELAACEAPVETDARGNLGNPPDGGFRSGIGLISGWVCAADEVEVVITLMIAKDPHRSPLMSRMARADPTRSGGVGIAAPNTGFGMTYNFNHLREGEYTIQAFADDEEIGEPRTFEVVHLTTFAVGDDDRFLRERLAGY